MANDRGEFWYQRAKDSWPSYPNKESWMNYIRMWFEEQDMGMADIAWDLVAMEHGEDDL